MFDVVYYVFRNAESNGTTLAEIWPHGENLAKKPLFCVVFMILEHTELIAATLKTIQDEAAAADCRSGHIKTMFGVVLERDYFHRGL